MEIGQMFKEQDRRGYSRKKEIFFGFQAKKMMDTTGSVQKSLILYYELLLIFYSVFFKLITGKITKKINRIAHFF